MRTMITIWLLATVVLATVARVGAAVVQIPQTGQTTCYDATGAVITCAGTGQEGDKLVGKPWPVPRFTDNGDGSVADNLTGLVWLKNAKCTDTVGGVPNATGALAWQSALTWSNSLASGSCGLSDGSAAGVWRMPNMVELTSLMDLSRSAPVLQAGHPFNNVQNGYYWSSSTSLYSLGTAERASMNDGYLANGGKANTNQNYLWPVRGGQ